MSSIRNLRTLYKNPLSFYRPFYNQDDDADHRTKGIQSAQYITPLFSYCMLK
jgi:hypothetical protein